MTHESAPRATTSSIDSDEFGQVVLVLQGGGALGAYQAGTYQAMHEAGLEPDWVVGTSIGAINGAIIAGNKVEDRLAKLQDFWHRFDARLPEIWGLPEAWGAPPFGQMTPLIMGIPGY